MCVGSQAYSLTQQLVPSQHEDHCQECHTSFILHKLQLLSLTFLASAQTNQHTSAKFYPNRSSHY